MPRLQTYHKGMCLALALARANAIKAAASMAKGMAPTGATEDATFQSNADGPFYDALSFLLLLVRTHARTYAKGEVG